jgi:hypothetical protein
MDGKLFMEVNPPVDGEGRTTPIDREVISRKLRLAFDAYVSPFAPAQRASGFALWEFYDSASLNQGGCKLPSMIRAPIATS